jgi:ketosteroid isomerase-like protein
VSQENVEVVARSIDAFNRAFNRGGRGKTSGLEMSAKAASVFHVREGRVSRIVVSWDRDRALADLGLEE